MESERPKEAPIEPLISKHIWGADNSIRSRIADWLEVRALEPGITNTEIARRMGISRQSLQALIYKAQQEGLLKFEDPLDKIEYEVIPKVVNNLNHYLDAKDKTVTIETAKGTIFKAYQESKGINEAAQTILALKIEAAPGGEGVKVVSGHIVGKPREVE